MVSLIFEHQIVFYFQLFLSANVRHRGRLACYVILSYSVAYITHPDHHHDKHVLPTIFSKKSFSMMQIFL